MEQRSSLHFRFVSCTRPVYGTMLLLLIAARLSTALPVISEISAIGGDRGVAISFSADAPFAAEFSGHEKSVIVSLKGCIYGLKEFLYENLPAASPIRSISAVEKKSATVELTIVLRHPVRHPVKAIQKNTQWIALLSDEAVQPFTWNTAQHTPGASPDPSAAAQPDPKPDRQGLLENIRLLQRGQIGELALEFDTDVSCSLNRSGTTVTITMKNVRNGIGSRQLLLPENGAFKRVSLREYDREGSAALDVAVLIDTAHLESNFNIAFTHGAVVSLFVIYRDNRNATLWTSGRGLSWNYQFYEVPSYNVDMNSIGKRALHDASVKLAREKTFAIKEPTAEPSPDTASTMAPVVEVPAPAVEKSPEPEKGPGVRIPMVVASEKVNLRSSPSRTATITGKLARGDDVTVVEKDGEWCKVEIQGQTGYVVATLLHEKNAGDDSVGRGNDLDRRHDLPAHQVSEPSSSITPVSRVIASAPASPAVPPTMTAEIPAGDTSRNAVAPPGVQKRVIRYQTGGRDPFKPIASSSVSLSGLPFVENLTLVGVLFDDEDRIALCEDLQNENRPFAFREYDPVEKGKVLKIYSDKAVFLITEYGVSRSFTLELFKESPEQEASKK